MSAMDTEVASGGMCDTYQPFVTQDAFVQAYQSS